MASEEMRKKVTDEILNTEESYVLGLEIINAFTRDPEISKILNAEIPDFNKFFAPILGLNRSLLGSMRTLKRENPDAPDAVILEKAILEHAELLKMYNSYLANYERMIGQFSRLLEENKKFKGLHENFFKGRNPNTIGAYIIMPVQRGPRYKLLLEQLQSRTPQDSPRRHNTDQALSKIEKVTRHGNEAIRLQEQAEAFYQFFQKLPANDPIKVFTLQHEKNKGPLVNEIKQHLMELNSRPETQRLLRNYLTSKSCLNDLKNPRINSRDFQKNMIEQIKLIRRDVLLEQLNTNDDWDKLKEAVDNIATLKDGSLLNAEIKARLLGKLGEIKITQLLKKLETKDDWDKLKSVLKDIKALQEAQKIIISDDYIKKAEEKIRYKSSETVINNLRAVIEIIQKDPKLSKKLGLTPSEVRELQDHAAALGYRGNNPEALAIKQQSLNKVLKACNAAKLEIKDALTKIKQKIAEKQKPSVFKKLFMALARLFGFQEGIQAKYHSLKVPKQYQKPLEQYEQLHQHYRNILKAINTLTPKEQAQKAKVAKKSSKEIVANERALAKRQNIDHTFLPTARKKVEVHHEKVDDIVPKLPSFPREVPRNPRSSSTQ